jgi:hypothetical protein
VALADVDMAPLTEAIALALANLTYGTTPAMQQQQGQTSVLRAYETQLGVRERAALTAWDWSTAVAPKVHLSGAYADAARDVDRGASELPSPLMRALEAWTIYLERFMPAERQKLEQTLVSGERALAGAQREIEAMAESDVGWATRPVLDLIEALYRPERAWQMRAALTGRVQLMSYVVAALALAHAGVQRYLQGWRGVPCDLLTGIQGHDAENEIKDAAGAVTGHRVPPGSTAPPELMIDFARLVADHINKQRLVFPDRYKTQKDFALSPVEFFQAIQVLRDRYRCRGAPGQAWTIIAV